MADMAELRRGVRRSLPEIAAVSDKPLGDPEDDQPTVGLADGIRTLQGNMQGSQFQCESGYPERFQPESCVYCMVLAWGLASFHWGFDGGLVERFRWL